jgi:hypothetical protein
MSADVAGEKPNPDVQHRRPAVTGHYSVILRRAGSGCSR